MALVLLAAALTPAPAVAAEDGCLPSPDPVRWTDAGTPDVGRQPTGIAVHRGAAELAPENTLDAYRYAIAYGVEMIEVDVHQLRDGRFVSFHDSEVDRKTDGTGRIADMSYEEVRRLNAADNDKWRGSEYDPAQIPSMEEVLELARATNTGIYFDVKESVVSGVADLANLAAEYGVLERSLWRTFDPFRDEAIKTAQPGAQLMFSNYDESLGPEVFFGASSRYRWFGSDLEEYSPEKIAAIHDGCSLAILNTYGGGITGSEGGDTVYARNIGADAVQVNRPDVGVAALQRPVATVIELRDMAGAGIAARQITACLVDARHRFGLPGKTLRFEGGTALTRRNGCATFTLPRSARRLAFEADGSALASEITFGAPARAVRRGTASLRAPLRRCRRGPFTATVRGRSIRRVTFKLDGRPLRRVARRENRFSVRVRARRLVVGRHRLTARVTFAAGSQTEPRTVRRRFAVCARLAIPLIRPRFTG